MVGNHCEGESPLFSSTEMLEEVDGQIQAMETVQEGATDDFSKAYAEGALDALRNLATVFEEAALEAIDNSALA